MRFIKTIGDVKFLLELSVSMYCIFEFKLHEHLFHVLFNYTNLYASYHFKFYCPIDALLGRPFSAMFAGFPNLPAVFGSTSIDAKVNKNGLQNGKINSPFCVCIFQLKVNKII